ncbi:MAG: serine protease [Verrucomicrobiota bacterium]
MSGFGERPVAGESVKGFFRNKVGLITVKGGKLPIGRAVPVTADGYYLTAWHVVDGGGFRLSNSVLSETGLRIDEYPGRIVWHDKLADLAVVKFPFRPPYLFKAGETTLVKGEPVFSGASGKNSGTLAIAPNSSGAYHLEDVLKNGIGNGDFQTAGKVVAVSLHAGPPLRTVSHSTLVGRGGMSGGPVVDDKGRLVGIVTGGQATLFSPPTTSFSMLDPEALHQMIRADRGRQ